MNRSIEDLVQDTRRDVSSGLIRLGCNPFPSNETWARWRKECRIKPNEQLVTRYETILLICRSQWKLIRQELELPQRSPTLEDLIEYGLPWFAEKARELPGRIDKMGEIFSTLLEPSQTDIDPFWGVYGRDLVKAVRAITGKAWSESTIRNRCLKLGWLYSRDARYSYAKVMKLSKAS